MRCGFHLASLPEHDEATLVMPLAKLGYQCVAHRATRSLLSDDAGEKERTLGRLRQFTTAGIDVIMDADGKFLLDPWDREAPRLARSEEVVARETILGRLIDVAGCIGCKLVTFSVGDTPTDEDAETVLKRLADVIIRLVERSAIVGVTLAIKPTLGGAIETASHFRRLMEWLPSAIATSGNLGWAADISVMARRGELPIGDRLVRDLSCTRCIYLSDIATGEAGDRRFGHGELAIRRIVHTISDSGYQGPLVLRCEGHGDDGCVIAKEAIELVRS
jgi:sugar phosphate isomerase/epimerase